MTGSFPNVFPGWLVDLYPLRVVYLKILNLCRKLQIYWKFYGDSLFCDNSWTALSLTGISYQNSLYG